MSQTDRSKSVQTMTPAQLVTHMEWLEVDGEQDVQFRRLVRDERQAVTLALRSGEGRKIRAAVEEARRVLGMWGQV